VLAYGSYKALELNIGNKYLVLLIKPRLLPTDSFSLLLLFASQAAYIKHTLTVSLLNLLPQVWLLLRGRREEMIREEKAFLIL
jgi:hypothetical protein